MGYDRKAQGREALEEAARSASGLVPDATAVRPPPPRPAVVPGPTSPDMPPPSSGPGSAATQPGPAAAAAVPPPLATVGQLSPPTTHAAAGPQDAHPHLPGRAVGANRRALVILVPPETNDLLERSRLGTEPRGRTIARALKIASSQLVARAAEPDLDDDPWFDGADGINRRHRVQPLRVSFSWSNRQAEALVDLAQRCGERNYSRLVSDAIEIAFGTTSAESG